MFTVAALLELHALTHRSLLKVLDHCEQLSAEELYRELPGFGFASIHSQLFHIIDCEEWWSGGLSGKSRAEHQPAEYPDVAALRGYRARIAQLTQDYLGTLSAEELNAPRQFTSGEHTGSTEKLALFLLHAMTHAFHHKGQVVAMCRLLGYPPPETDLID
jgi:uncharacterized damage-inducible protein DinB